MDISRRAFAGGALSVALGTQLSSPAFAQAGPAFAQAGRGLAAALTAIRAHGEAHLAFNNLPGMTLGLVAPNGERSVLNFGYANRDSRLPIDSGTLFQIGSISKVMVALIVHQLAAEGRLRLDDRISNILPAAALPRGNIIAVQHLLDHVAGLPGDAPLFPDGGLWTAYPPGQHWHYSNTAYDMLGKLAEHVGGKPLDQLLQSRIFAPLGMNRSHGAIRWADRVQYAQGYEAADQMSPYVRGVPLAPAPWVDVTFGAGSVASTADDMMPFLRALADAVQGRGALGLSPQQARQFASHAVPSELPGVSYGNGLMHAGEEGRAYLHHTGGMLSFSSSFHVDVASGVGAFASSTINAFAEYRPRLLTRFAVDAVTNALAGHSIPAPPALEPLLANAQSFAGRFSGPNGAFQVLAGPTLKIVSGGQNVSLIATGDSVFRTLHLQFRDYSLQFERQAGKIATIAWGPETFVRDGSGIRPPASDPALAKLAGRYVNDNPWFGPAPVVERGGKLWIGTEMPMTRIGENLWRVGKEAWSPERGSFANFIDGRPQTFLYSGEKFLRHEL